MLIYLELYSAKSWPMYFKQKEKNIVINKKMWSKITRVKDKNQQIKQTRTKNIQFDLYDYFFKQQEDWNKTKLKQIKINYSRT